MSRDEAVLENTENALDERRKNNRSSKNITGVPRPFMKWAGGKRQILKQLDSYIPAKFNSYLEPFVGGGALFFYLLPEKSVLLDNNSELINIYKVVKTKVNELIERLKNHVNEEEYYYRVRNVDRDVEKFSKLSDIERASRNIFLNRCCFNGLYRVNKKGQFNVPFGKYKNPNFCDVENLLAASDALQNAEIHDADFEKCLDLAGKDDLVYFDPPYVPLSDTAYFTSYTKDKFGPGDQERLCSVFKELDERGCKVMLSNSYCNFILDLYEGYRIETIQAVRAINCDATKRGKIKEVLVLNY